MTENVKGATEMRAMSSGLRCESQRSRMCVVLSFLSGKGPPMRTDLPEVLSGTVSEEHTDPRSRSCEHLGASGMSWAASQGVPL